MKRLEIDTTPGEGRPILLVVLIVAALIITTVWYREGDRGPLHAARGVVLFVRGPAAVVGTWLATPFRAASTYVSESAVSRDEYVAIQKQNDALKARVAALEEARQENIRLRGLVKFAQAQDYGTIGARVIGRPPSSWERTIVIDRGTASGVATDAPVIAAGGLVGQVVDETAGSAKVRLITAADSGVAVIVQRTRAEGVVRGSLDGKLTLDFVTKESKPIVGDVLITSGLGGVYPKGIVVGEVTDVAAPQADLFPSVMVTSRVAIDSIEEVLVMIGPGPAPSAGGNE